jgi:hypothetical protein
VVTDPEDEGRLERALDSALVGYRECPEAPGAVPGGGVVLEQVSRQCAALVESVWTLCEQVAATRTPVVGLPSALTAGAANTSAPLLVPPPAGIPVDTLTALQAIQRQRQARERFFPKGLFEDPCWDMLLDLMVNHLQGRRISVSSLCIASGVAQTTALRRISDLHRRGLVRRSADDKDGRRVFIELTEAGLSAMRHYVESMEPLG